MNREDYQKVKKIFQAAFDLAPVERAAFLDDACRDNEDLRREVQRLLDSFESGYLEQPAIGKMAESVVAAGLSNGQIVGRYKIHEKIGAGGMGEVFAAEDMRLKRKIALKILPALFSLDKERLHRFEQEACAASALNHPNILTVHEFGADEGTIFIASEFVKGETLRERLTGKSLDLSEALYIALQIAAALNAAHESGIIHRDIKPENIMLRDDGLVKVLDFGLAKLIEKKNEPVDVEADTLSQVDTTPGMVMGTPAYMSPEQVRGLPTDARTDIWSFGVVLYEMLTGRAPFAGETTSDKIASILKSEAAPLARNAPPELKRIIGKTLKKNQDERYQSIKDLLTDLKNLRRDVDLKAEAITGDTASGQPTSENHPDTIPNTISEIKPRRSIAPKLAIAAIILLLSAAGFGLYRLSTRQSAELFQQMRLTKLTYTGNAANERVAVAPDGKYVVYVVEEAAMRSLWVKHIPTSGNVQIAAPSEISYGGLVFSRDGNYVYYSVRAKNASSAIYQVPVLGGNARKLLENVNGAIAISPKGDEIAFVRGKDLMIAAIDDGAERLVATSSNEVEWTVLAWSPDGKTIVTNDISEDESTLRLVEIETEGGTKKPVASPAWLGITGINWLPDGSGLVLTGRDLENQLSQIWMLTYPEGKLRKISNDLNTYKGLSLTADGKSLVSLQQEMLSNIWVAPAGDIANARQITFEKGKDEGLSGVAWTSDGRIVYTVRITGTPDLWIVNEDGSDNRQLTFNEQFDFSPAVSPDNKYIVFVSTRAGGSNLWRIDIDGGNPKQLTDSPDSPGAPYISPDGKWVFYQLDVEKPTVWKVSIDGGAPVQLTDYPSEKPVVSPDGKFFVCRYGEAAPDSPAKLAVVPLSGGQPSKVLDLPAVVKSRNFRWSADGKALIYIDNRKEIYNLWSQSLDGGAPQQLTDFKSDRVFRFDLSNKGFALARGHENSEVIMIDKFY
jgi:eukaryotic-like serine/threonine-protein kinase